MKRCLNMTELNIYQKLIEVRKSVPYLKKESQGHQYQYTGSSQVLAAVRAKMDELGLMLICKVLGHNLIEGKTSKGAKEFMTELDLEFTWINAEKPEEVIICPWYGQGVDNSEKGVGKSLTYAEKYFILKDLQYSYRQRRSRYLPRESGNLSSTGPYYLSRSRNIEN
jgi:hypothetical protein